MSAFVLQNNIAWYDANHTVNAVAAQKALYYNLRARFPQLPSQFVNI